jgi:hypothetical protein
MKAETQIKIARGTAFFLIIALLAGPLMLVGEKLNRGESVTWQFALLYIGIVYVFLLPFIVLCCVFAWSLKRRKQKTALALFILLAIWAIATVIAEPITMPIELVVSGLLVQGVLGMRKTPAMPTPESIPS